LIGGETVALGLGTLAQVGKELTKGNGSGGKKRSGRLIRPNGWERGKCAERWKELLRIGEAIFFPIRRKGRKGGSAGGGEVGLWGGGEKI